MRPDEGRQPINTVKETPQSIPERGKTARLLRIPGAGALRILLGSPKGRIGFAIVMVFVLAAMLCRWSPR